MLDGKKSREATADLKHSRLLIQISQFLYSNASVFDSVNACSLADNANFVLTIENFLRKQAFLMADNKSPCPAFKSQALTNVLKIIFEGQCRQLPAMLYLKALYPEELASAPFTNYLELTSSGQGGERSTTESSATKIEKL